MTEQRLPDDVPRSGVIVAGSRAAQRPSRDARIAGVLLSLAGAAILMGFITAEALYPGVFTTHTNTVSHLGASEPPNSVVLQPSAAIFDITMLVTGAMILAGAWFAYRSLRRQAVLVPIESASRRPSAGPSMVFERRIGTTITTTVVGAIRGPAPIVPLPRLDVASASCCSRPSTDRSHVFEARSYW